MTTYFLESLTVHHYDIFRYWTGTSEPFAPADALVTALSEGWNIKPVIRRKDFRLRAGTITVYYFDLYHGQRSFTMPVTANPYITRFIVHNKIRVIAVQNDSSVEVSSMSASRRR